MTVAGQIKVLDKKLCKRMYSMILTEKQLKYLHCLLKKHKKALTFKKHI